MLLYIYQISIFQSFLVALYYYKYLKGSYMKWFLPFLGLTSVLELCGNFTSVFIYRFNINYMEGLTQFTFYGYIFYRLNKSKGLKRIAMLFVLFNWIALMGSYFFFDLHRSSMHYYLVVFVIFSFFISMIALMYLYAQFHQDNSSNLVREPGFWISIGVAVFYSGVSITFSMYDIIIRDDLRLFGVRLYNFVPRILCLPLYVSISIAIYLHRYRIRHQLISK